MHADKHLGHLVLVLRGSTGNALPPHSSIFLSVLALSEPGLECDMVRFMPFFLSPPFALIVAKFRRLGSSIARHAVLAVMERAILHSSLSCLLDMRLDSLDRTRFAAL